MDNRKVVIIGDGMVGSTIAYTLMMKDYVNEIVIIDIVKEKVEGDALDMMHGVSFVSPKLIKTFTLSPGFTFSLLKEISIVSNESAYTFILSAINVTNTTSIIVLNNLFIFLFLLFCFIFILCEKNFFSLANFC